MGGRHYILSINGNDFSGDEFSVEYHAHEDILRVSGSGNLGSLTSHGVESISIVHEPSRSVVFSGAVKLGRISFSHGLLSLYDCKIQDLQTEFNPVEPEIAQEAPSKNERETVHTDLSKLKVGDEINLKKDGKSQKARITLIDEEVSCGEPKGARFMVEILRDGKAMYVEWISNRDIVLGKTEDQRRAERVAQKTGFATGGYASPATSALTAYTSATSASAACAGAVHSPISPVRPIHATTVKTEKTSMLSKFTQSLGLKS